MTFKKNTELISGHQDYSKRKIIVRTKSKKEIEKVSTQTQSQTPPYATESATERSIHE
jgi:hypothetical protein